MWYSPQGIAKLSQYRRSYCIHRMGIAMDRLVFAQDTVEQRQACKWARAWAFGATRTMQLKFALRALNI